MLCHAYVALDEQTKKSKMEHSALPLNQHQLQDLCKNICPYLHSLGAVAFLSSQTQNCNLTCKRPALLSKMKWQGSVRLTGVCYNCYNRRLPLPSIEWSIERQNYHCCANE
ncbi:hypothetical protein L596_029851 [Steinernema carpocapsae]|uniref:Uncharacterized protein n=1 Tax=Steinernema carpocapsae TaxID=34508 RepID=A0A4U5LR06_STECR|nr:hypothetical protein L596_029851 [Steinernema carpocapsae]